MTDQPVDRERVLPDADRAAGYRDRRQERTEDHQRALAQDQADPPGDDERPKLAAVEAPDDRAFEQRAEHADYDEGQDGAEPERNTAVPRDARGVGAHHHQLAMGEVDDVHHAEDDDQAERGKQKKCAVGRELIENADKRSETVHARGSAPARSRDRGSGDRVVPDREPRAPPSCLRSRPSSRTS